MTDCYDPHWPTAGTALISSPTPIGLCPPPIQASPSPVALPDLVGASLPNSYGPVPWLATPLMAPLIRGEEGWPTSHLLVWPQSVLIRAYGLDPTLAQICAPDLSQC